MAGADEKVAIRVRVGMDSAPNIPQYSIGDSKKKIPNSRLQLGIDLCYVM